MVASSPLLRMQAKAAKQRAEQERQQAIEKQREREREQLEVGLGWGGESLQPWEAGSKCCLGCDFVFAFGIGGDFVPHFSGKAGALASASSTVAARHRLCGAYCLFRPSRGVPMF